MRPQDGARLRYRPSEHGFKAADFWQRCVGKANTLMLVQVSPPSALPRQSAAHQMDSVLTLLLLCNRCVIRAMRV